MTAFSETHVEEATSKGICHTAASDAADVLEPSERNQSCCKVISTLCDDHFSDTTCRTKETWRWNKIDGMSQSVSRIGVLERGLVTSLNNQTPACSDVHLEVRVAHARGPRAHEIGHIDTRDLRPCLQPKKKHSSSRHKCGMSSVLVISHGQDLA